MSLLAENVASSPAAGIEALFRRVFETQVDYVCHSLGRLGVHPGDIEDVAQELFLAVHRKLSSYDPSRPLRPWLFGFAFRSASDYRRRTRFSREISSDEDAPSDAPLPDIVLETSERCALLEAALARIDLDRRAVIVLHDLDEQAMPEVAEALAIPLNTAYSRLRLGRAELRSQLGRLLASKGCAP